MYLTVNATSKETGLSKYLLRAMQKNGTLPGFRNGNRFMVNVPLLLDQLEQESRKSISDKTNKQ